jgi:secreted PhoX family phosphatase
MTSRADSPSRRRLLASGVAAAVGLSPLGKLLAQSRTPPVLVPGYGPLAPVRDLETGLPLLALPRGFSYRTFGWAGEALPGDVATPDRHDGMGVVGVDGDIVTLVRNHEVGRGSSFAPAAATYDARAGGGTVTLRFDTRRGVAVDARPSLSGTVYNCAGGSTPWGTWLSCEEVVTGEGEAFSLKGLLHPYARTHGWVFEVPATGLASAEPLTALGCFRHEAAAVDPADGIVYLTEDEKPQAGFYRFVPDVAGELRRGGRLQMLKAIGAPDLRTGRRAGERLKIAWVDIDEPGRGIDADGGGYGVLRQGVAGGASVFTRLEGVVVDGARVWFTSTSGGDAACGQLWLLHPRSGELELVYEAPSRDVLHYPDNIVPSPRGGLVVCEDSDYVPQRLWGIAPGGGQFELCRNLVRLDGTKGIEGDFRDEEWAGTCFSPDGRWLFANLYRPGFSVAITGPWNDGPL